MKYLLSIFFILLTNFSFGAVYTDGVDDVVTVDNESNFDFEITDKFSITAWIYWNTGESNDIVVSKRISASPHTGWTFGILDQAGTNRLTLLFYHYDGTHKYRYRRVGGSGFVTEVWTHIACTNDGSDSLAAMKLYVNGTEATSYSDDNNDPTTILNNEPVRIGVDPESSRYFKGYISNVTIIDKVLTLNEIKSEMERFHIPGTRTVGCWDFTGESYDSKIAQDLSGNNNDGTHTGTSTSDNPPILMQPIYAGQ